MPSVQLTGIVPMPKFDPTVMDKSLNKEGRDVIMTAAGPGVLFIFVASDDGVTADMYQVRLFDERLP